MTTLAGLDLRRAPITELGEARGWRSPQRDFWADEAALWDRWTAHWGEVDDVAWSTPVAKSDAGGPDWTFLDHVGHVASWAEAGSAYIARARDGGSWPRDEDFAADNLGQDIQCTIYEYPDRFTEGGYPVFLNNNQ